MCARLSESKAVRLPLQVTLTAKVTLHLHVLRRYLETKQKAIT